MSSLRSAKGLTQRGDAVASDEVGQVALYRDSTGNAQVVTLTADGKIPVDAGTVVGGATSAKQDTAITALGTLATQTTAAAILAKLSADPATQTTAAAILAKLSADPATQTTLAAVLAKLSSDPATQTTLAALTAKDFATQTTLAAVLAKIIAAPATEAKQDATNTKLDTLHADVDGLEAGVGAPADAVASADTGTFSLVSIAKRTLARWTLLLAATGAAADAKSAATDTTPISMVSILKQISAYLAAALIMNLTKVGGTDLQSGTTGRGAIPIEIQDPATGLAAVINPSVAKTSDYPYGATPLSASSGNVANAAAAATLAGAASKTTYCAGFTVAGAGATGALVVDVTVTGAIGGTMTYTYAAVAGAALMNQTLNVKFDPPLAASGQNTAIVISCPALGTGALKNTCNAHGYQL